MKNLKTLLMAALMICTVSVMAQDRPQGQGQQRQQWTVQSRAEREAAQIHGAVALSDAQIAQVYKVTYKYAMQDSIRMTEMRAAREQGKEIDREAWRKQREEVSKAKTEEINAVLTPEQKTKYAKLLEEQRNRQGQGRQGGRQGGPQGQGR